MKEVNMIVNPNQSPTQWPPLTSRIDLCQRLTVLQDSCKMHLCSRFCYLETIFLFSYIFSCDIKFNILIETDCKERNSDFLILLVRPSRHYHPLSYRLIAATTDYYTLFHSFTETTSARNCGLLHLGAVQPSSLQDWST